MPLIASRGGGSVKGYGRLARAGVNADTDNFDRSTSGNLGNSSNRGSLWTTRRGAWQADGTRATSNSSAGTNSIATIVGSNSNISNLQVDTLGTGGVGVAFWVVDDNNWYAATTFHSITTSSSTSCTGGGAGPQGGSYPASCCGGYYTQTLYCTELQCENGAATATCRTGSYPPSPAFSFCTGKGGYGANAQYTETTYGCTQTTVTTTTTTYKTNFRIINNGTSVVNTEFNSNNSAYQTAGSIAISTSGDTISYTVYSGANKTGSTLHSGTYTPSNPIKGNNVGIFKGDGGSNQGSSVDNFSLTLS